MIKKIINSVFFLCCFYSSVFASNNILNVYNWSGYIPSDVLTKFTNETGIRVNYSTFDSNETLYAKLKVDKDSGYDIVVPSTYYVERMRREKMLQKIDKSKLPNFKYLNPALLNRSYDPYNEYSIPYLWGTTAILINTKYFPINSVKVWHDLWKPEFKGKIAFTDSMRDGFAIAMKVLGYSINDTNPKHMEEAYGVLKSLLPNIQSFQSSGAQQTFVNEDSVIGIMESGDANVVMSEKSSLAYIYPKDGAIIWADNMAIPINAKHLNNAYQFINFILRPDIAKMISVGVGYSSPNLGAIKLMSKEDRKNPVLNPSEQDLKNGEFEGDVGEKATQQLLKYWELLKAGA